MTGGADAANLIVLAFVAATFVGDPELAAGVRGEQGTGAILGSLDRLELLLDALVVVGIRGSVAKMNMGPPV